MSTRSRRRATRALVAAVVVIAAMAATAMAAQPRRGVNLYGPTSWKGGDDPVSYVFVQVARSGKTVASINLPTSCGIHPPTANRFAITSRGTFSGTRTLKKTYHNTTVTWTLKVHGTFTAPTKAKGTFSESFTGSQRCQTGRQTWSATHVGSSV